MARRQLQCSGKKRQNTVTSSTFYKGLPYLPSNSYRRGLLAVSITTTASIQWMREWTLQLDSSHFSSLLGYGGQTNLSCFKSSFTNANVYHNTPLADGDCRTCLRKARVCLIIQFTRKYRWLWLCYHNEAQFPKFKAESRFQHRIWADLSKPARCDKKKGMTVDLSCPCNLSLAVIDDIQD